MKDQSRTKKELLEEISDLKQKIQELEHSESERKRVEERLTRINTCLLSLGPDFDENVARLTALCGELLGATCALYNRLESGMLYSIGRWHTPPDYAAEDKPDGHICYDVIRQGSDEVLVVHNLPQTPYAATDPNVTKYGLRTYLGQLVRCAGKPVGSLCVVFQRDVESTDDDKRILGIIASSLTSEEGRKRMEESLRKNRRQLTDIIDFLPDATFAIDKERRVIIWNKAIEKMTGIPAAEMIGQGDYAYTIPFYGEARPHLMDLVFEHQEEIAARYPNITREGDTIITEVFCNALNDNKGAWVFAKASPLHDQAGNIVGAIESIRDITERKRTEEKICKMNTFLVSIVENIPNMLFLKDARNLRFVRFNRAGEDLLGYSRDDLLGKSDYDFFPKDQADFFTEKDREVLRGKEIVDIPEEPLQTRNKGERILHTKKVPILGANGEPEYLLGISEDIIDRKKAEKELSERQRERETLLINLPGMVYRCRNDKLWTMEFVSKGCLALTGYFPDDLIHNRRIAYNEIIHPDDRERIWREVQEALLKRDHFRLTYRILTEQGDVRWVWEQGTGIFSPEEELLFLEGFITDITERKWAEEALVSSERNYRDIFNAINDAIVIHDMETGAILDVNKIMEKMWGYTHEEAMRIDVGALSHGEPPYSQQDAESWIRKAATEGPQMFEWLARRKNGELFWLEVKLQIVVIADQRRIMAVNRDITERKQVEEALEKSVAQLRTLIDTIPDLVWLKDPAGVYLACNPRFEQFFGAKEKNIIGKTDYDFVDRELADFFRENDRKAIAAGKPTINEEEIAYAYDGHREILETIKTPISGVSGEILGVLGIGRNITERKRTEEALRESEARLREAQSIAHIGNLGLDFLTKTFTWSDETFRIFEIDKDHFAASYEEFLGTTHPEDRNAVNAAYMQSLETRKPFVFSNRLLMRDGRIKWVQIQCVTHYNPEGKPLRSVGTIQDISVQKQLEDQLRQSQKMETIGTFAGGIAHDFNNILSAIIGFTEISIRNVPPGSKLEDNLQRVLNAGIRARDLVKQILAFSRQTDRVVKPVQVKLIVKEALKFIRASSPATIEIHQDIGSGSLIMGDPTQIHQIIMNLCTNAAHAMQDTGGKLVVGLTDVELGADVTDPHPDMAPGQFIKLTVSDSGCGIAPEIRDRIFDPFYTTKGLGEGTGLGLSVVHGIVKDCGGMISVESTPGKGSTFNVFFPVIENEQGAENVARVPLPTGNERILFVDDEEQQVEMGKQVLELLGYRVTTKTSSMEALNVFRAKPDEFDLVVTDLTMPKMTGDVLAKEIMAIRSDVPVILCTGYSEKITPAKAKTLGIKEVIMKPAVVEEIARTVRMVLDQPFKK
jgi:PAS domain S-box-containing protein